MGFKQPDGTDITPTHPTDLDPKPPYLAADGADVSVDDSGFTTVVGDTVQEAIASIDTTITP